MAFPWLSCDRELSLLVLVADAVAEAGPIDLPSLAVRGIVARPNGRGHGTEGPKSSTLARAVTGFPVSPLEVGFAPLKPLLPLPPLPPPLPLLAAGLPPKSVITGRRGSGAASDTPATEVAASLFASRRPRDAPPPPLALPAHPLLPEDAAPRISYRPRRCWSSRTLSAARLRWSSASA